MLILNQGNTYTLNYTVKNSDGTVKNLTGTQELKYEMSRRVNSTPILQYVLADVEVSIVDPVNGNIQIKLSPEVLNSIKVGNYYHELWQINATGDKLTLMTSNVTIQDRLIKE